MKLNFSVKGKDWIFIFVMGIIGTNLAWQASAIGSAILRNNDYGNFAAWAFFLSDLIAIVGLIWLMRIYRQWRIHESK